MCQSMLIMSLSTVKLQFKFDEINLGIFDHEISILDSQSATHVSPVSLVTREQILPLERQLPCFNMQ